jgi:hypothetical protein
MTRTPEIIEKSESGFFHFVSAIDAAAFLSFVESKRLQEFSVVVADLTKIDSNDGICLELSRKLRVGPFSRWGGVLDSISELASTRDGFVALFLRDRGGVSLLEEDIVEMMSVCCQEWLRVGKPYHVVFVSQSPDAEDRRNIRDSI